MVFTVTGETRYHEVLLVTDTLKFDANSKLVIAPLRPREKDIIDSLPRTLTIIAKDITITGKAEITYDLDGVPGLDPDTPAAPIPGPAANGSDGWTDPSAGAYPTANNGGGGSPGMPGIAGNNGRDAPSLEIFVEKVSSGQMKINFKGQDAGRGGKGGDGGKGGNGQKGAPSTADDSWYDGDECTREPGRGGNGGRGGDAGHPGRGGDGGNGGIVKVFVFDASLPRVNAWEYIVNGGKRGETGDPGTRGEGGTGGPPGDQNDPCPARSEYAGSDGPPGRSMSEIDPQYESNLEGEDGKDGDWAAYSMSVLPQ